MTSRSDVGSEKTSRINSVGSWDSMAGRGGVGGMMSLRIAPVVG